MAKSESVIGPYNEDDNLTLTCDVYGGQPISCYYILPFLNCICNNFHILQNLGKPSPTVTWYVQGYQINEYSLVVNNDCITSELNIIKLKRSNLWSNVTCLASNSDLIESLKAAVTIDMNRKWY